MPRTKAASALLDAPKNMPPENVAALKAFLVAKRGQGLPVRAFAFTREQEEAFSTLPPAVGVLLKTFLTGIRETVFFNPDGKPQKWWRVSYGGTLEAARVIADKKTQAMSGLANDHHRAMDAIILSVVRAADRSVADEVASSAAMDAVWATMRKVDRAVIRDAVRDARLMARMIIASDAQFTGREEYMQGVKDRWEVWQKGYALVADYRNLLYVYCKGQRPKRSR